MKKSSTRLLIICTTALISSCASAGLPYFFPAPPAIDQCTYSIRYQKWRCKTKSGRHEDRRLDDPRMENAEATTQQGYLESKRWLDDVADVARNRCH